MPAVGGDVARQVGQIVYVELRKIVWTRSSQVVLLVTAALGLLLSAGMTIFGERSSEVVDLATPLVGLSFGVALGAPLIGVLIMTSDWQSRESLTVFLLQPRRGIVFAGKLTAALVLSLLAVAAVVVISAVLVVGMALLTGNRIEYQEAGSALRPLLVVCLVGGISGAALASAIMSTPLAVLGVVLQVLVVDPILQLLPGKARDNLSASSLTDYLSGEGALVPACCSFLLWVVVPLGIGFWRVWRREIR